MEEWSFTKSGTLTWVFFTFLQMVPNRAKYRICALTIYKAPIQRIFVEIVNPLNANPLKWSNTQTIRR